MFEAISIGYLLIGFFGAGLAISTAQREKRHSFKFIVLIILIAVVAGPVMLLISLFKKHTK